MTTLWEPTHPFLQRVVYILGGGASVAEEPLVDAVPAERLIAVNWALERRPDAAYCLFRDSYFRDGALSELKAFKGTIVSRAEAAGQTRNALGGRGREVKFYAGIDGVLSTRKGYLCGSNSGHNAVNLALQMGPPSMIALIGFDGGPLDSKYNFHDHYQPGRGGHHFYESRWNPDMITLEKARRIHFSKTRIVNCSLRSHITAFPKVSLAGVLNEDLGRHENGRGVQAESRASAA